MNSKIIFFDIDGTLLNETNNVIPISAKEAIKQAQANGHLAFINTGRTIAEIDTEIIEMGFDGYICGCGTYISYGDSILLQDSIPTAISKEIIQDLRKLEIDAVLEGKAAVYYNNHIIAPAIKRIRDYHSKNYKVESWDASDISIDKFCIYTPTVEAFNLFYEKYNHNFDFIRRSKRFSEIIPTGYSKATGILFLLNYLDIPHENTYAIGDSMNDVTMLEYVKYSIAMGNSCKEILEMVSYITDDVDHDGISNALKYYNII